MGGKRQGLGAPGSALVAECNYHCEPEAIRKWLASKLESMYLRLCGDALCPSCHPERFLELKSGPPPELGPDHEPIDGPALWLEQTHREITNEVIEARLAGREPDVAPPPIVRRTYRNPGNPYPPEPPVERYMKVAEEDESPR